MATAGILQSTLTLIRDRLDEHLQRSTSCPDGWVVLSNIVDGDGRPEERTRNRLAMMLVGVEQDTTISTYNPAVPGRENVHTAVAPPLYVNLSVLFYANCTGLQYPAGLALLSNTLSFFQQTPVFTHHNLPGLDPGIDRIAVELRSPDVTDLGRLLAGIGARILPCALYRLRTIPFSSGMAIAEVRPAAGYAAPLGDA